MRAYKAHLRNDDETPMGTKSNKIRNNYNSYLMVSFTAETPNKTTYFFERMRFSGMAGAHEALDRLVHIDVWDGR